MAWFLNYKVTTMLKRIMLGLCIGSLFVGCTPGAIPPPTVTLISTPPTEITPSSTTLPTVTSLPTPIPEVRVAAGDQAFFNGDYDKAHSEYQAAFDNSDSPEVKAAALWGLGRIEYTIGNNARALEILWQLTSQYPASPGSVRAYFLRGKIFMALQRFSESAQAYSTYLSLRPGVIDAYVQEQRGDAFAASGDDSNAIVAFQAAIAAPTIKDSIPINIKIAQAYVRLGNTATAMEMYDTIRNSNPDDYVKAQLDLLSGQIYLSLGQSDLAYERFLHAVDNYPLAYDSYSALVALVNAGVPVDEMKRGLVDYFAGQLGYAHDAFLRFMESNPKNDGTAQYYLALTLFGLGQYEEAVQAWTAFIQNYPNNPHWASAWNGNSSLPGRAYTQWYYLGKYEEAAQTLLTFVNLAPTDPNAPIFLVEAGRIQERDGKLDQAAQTWDRVADEYPTSELVPQSLFWAGITRYRLGKFSDALVSFQREAILSTKLEDLTSSHFWIGKTQAALGDIASAQASWQQTTAIDSTDYYSLRAQDILLNRPAFQPLPAIDRKPNLAAERAETEVWLRISFNLATDTDLGSPGALLTDPRLNRGTEFLALGQVDEARSEFDSLRTAVEKDPADSYRLANYLLDLGLYYPAIFTFRQVLTLAGMNSQVQTLAAPAYFNHVRYGLYFFDLVSSSAQQYEFDPFFLLSVMRQESLFNPLANSGYAIGLMQITPDTGQFIANNLGWPPNFTPDDLFRPLISIGLGSSYLKTQSVRLNGDLVLALAAYNAGPDAASLWHDLSGPDSDLFLEIIRFEETRNYIRSIYEIYAMYKFLYTTIP